MSTTMAQPVSATTEDYEAAFNQLMAEAEGINERMGRDRANIERLESETKVITEDIVRLKEETRALLASMGAKV